MWISILFIHSSLENQNDDLQFDLFLRLELLKYSIFDSIYSSKAFNIAFINSTIVVVGAYFRKKDNMMKY